MQGTNKGKREKVKHGNKQIRKRERGGTWKEDNKEVNKIITKHGNN